MPEVHIASAKEDSVVHLDVCTSCSFLWFDPHEFEHLPIKPLPVPEPELPQEAKEKIALAQIQHQRQRMEEEDPSPDEDWKWIPAMMGMPVEHYVKPIRSLPWVTWGVAAMCIVLFLISLTDFEAAIQTFGLDPNDPLRYGGLNFLSSFLMHGGWMHLIGNLYFLIVFGDNVEDALGHVKYLMLLLASAFVADIAHMAFDDSGAVLVGASGGIAGILVYYAFQFPNAKLGIFCFIYYFPNWFFIPAWSALILWILMQGLGVYYQLAGFSNVSALAHLGGAAVGLVVWLLVKFMSPPKPRVL